MSDSWKEHIGEEHYRWLYFYKYGPILRYYPIEDRFQIFHEGKPVVGFDRGYLDMLLDKLEEASAPTDR
jgi:hypothetical protein